MSVIAEIIRTLKANGNRKTDGEQLHKMLPDTDKQTLYSMLSHYSRKSTLLLRDREGDNPSYVYWVNPAVPVPHNIQDDMLRLDAMDKQRAGDTTVKREAPPPPAPKPQLRNVRPGPEPERGPNVSLAAEPERAPDPNPSDRVVVRMPAPQPAAEPWTMPKGEFSDVIAKLVDRRNLLMRQVGHVDNAIEAMRALQ